MHKGPALKPAQCDICHTIVSRKCDLARHKMTHAEDAKKFVCPAEGCGYESLQRANVTSHMMTHSNIRLQCPDCEKTFASPSSLSHHRKNLHGYTPRFPKIDEVEMFFLWSCSDS
ncbi:hypothetical protein CPC08DRAFT_798329 [Agrocybe pediades]|nr:hypothetical protein CPC08DRAFT_798329 [Agrocybe pediades]